MRRWDSGRPAAWEDVRMRGQEAGGKKKDGERKKTKPYTTIPSRGFALSKLPLDRPHQGAVMLLSTFQNRRFTLCEWAHSHFLDEIGGAAGGS